MKIFYFIIPFWTALTFIFTGYGIAQESNSWTRNQTKTDAFIIEPPTLVCAGFEWKIYGDANRNAEVSVSYRMKDDDEWNDALSLLRIGGERIYGHGQRWVYTTPEMFAGSIFNLQPGTLYQCRFRLSDPDGTQGKTEKTVTIKTKSEPKPYPYGQTYHVYPPGYKGIKENPAFTGLNEAYYGGGNLGDWWLVPEPRVNPGDVILVHAGLYKGDPMDYVDPLALNFHGAYVLTQDGTPEKPIVIKAAGDGEVIFDGAGSYRLFDVMAADYNYFEGITVRNTNIVFYAGLKRVMGCKGLTVKNCRFEDVGTVVMSHSADSRDFYIADNIMVGRHDPDTLMGWYGFEHPTPLTSYYAIKVYGQSHVICYNSISYFHDGICVDTHGLPEKEEEKQCVSIDIYGNDIFNTSDDFVESDGGVHNIRVFCNRGFNSYHSALSAQPIFGGPVYFIKNILYHVPGTALKYMVRPAGIFTYSNTFCAEPSVSIFANGHFRNNLFLGHDDSRPTFSMSTLTNYSTLDYNGYRHKNGKGIQYIWRYPENDSMNNCDESQLKILRTRTLKEFSDKTGLEKHGIELDYDVFENVVKPDPDKNNHVYQRDGYDFRLKNGSKAIDAGCLLPNITDGYTGDAPDLGALEYGQPLPHYGPRKK